MNRQSPPVAVLGLIAVLALALAAGAVGGAVRNRPKPAKAETEHVQPPVETSEGSLEQLPGRLGCLAEGKAVEASSAARRGR